ncbi:MAG: hypothetical protein ACXACY_27720 [Candidatus Hodarchaeales archaeon]|jgi:hypothetical protein
MTRQSIHHHYDQLTENEQYALDQAFDDMINTISRQFDIPMIGDDRTERAVDAVAKAIIQSREQ